MKYKFEWWHLAIIMIALVFLYQAKIIPNFLGATLVSGDGYLPYGEYTLSDFINSAGPDGIMDTLEDNTYATGDYTPTVTGEGTMLYDDFCDGTVDTFSNPLVTITEPSCSLSTSGGLSETQSIFGFGKDAILKLDNLGMSSGIGACYSVDSSSSVDFGVKDSAGTTRSIFSVATSTQSGGSSASFSGTFDVDLNTGQIKKDGVSTGTTLDVSGLTAPLTLYFAPGGSGSISCDMHSYTQSFGLGLKKISVISSSISGAPAGKITPVMESCRDGFTYNSVSGKCVFQGCIAGYEYDSETHKCLSSVCGIGDTLGYTWNSVRNMCELSNSYLATWANEFGFTEMSCAAPVCVPGLCTTTCTSKYWDIVATESGEDAHYSGGDPSFTLSTGAGGDAGSSTITATSKQGFVGKNFKMDVDMTASKTHYGGSASSGVSIGGVTLASLSVPSEGTFHESGLIQTEENALDPNIYTLYYQGRKIQDVDTSGNALRVVIASSSGAGSGGDSSSSITVTKPRWQPLYSCEVGPGELLGYEIFAGPQDLSFFSTRYPVVRYCIKHPAVIFDKASGGSTTDATIYEMLRNGQTYAIPQGKVVGVFYVFKNDYSISLACPEEAYNINTTRCTNTSGLATVCSPGVFDSAYGTCVVTTDNILCPYGGRYDVAQNMCFYNPPIQYICAYGDYVSDKGRCEYDPDVDGVCPATHPDYPHIVYTWDNVAKVCYSVPASQILCPPYYGFDSTVGKCIFHAETEADCRYPICSLPTSTNCAIFNEEENICEAQLISNPICPTGAYISQDLSKCIYEPDSEHNCLQGGDYDSVTDKCIMEPDYDYLCLHGNYAVVNNHPACSIVMDDYYVCKDGFSWDVADKKCIQIDGRTCTQNIDCHVTCSDDSVVGECVNGKCEAGTCGTGTGWWNNLKQWLIDYMLYIMLFLMALLLFIMVVARGKFLSAKNLETFGRRNSDGLIIGLVAGAIFSLLALGLNPISWICLWTIISGGLSGCIIDALYKPKR